MQVPLGSLNPHYDALLFAYGASEDRTLGIPGEDLKGIHSARAFVGWYNGLPEYEGLQPDLQAGETALVVGNGNVALDIARILLSGVDVLRKTDISEQAIEVLKGSRIRHVNVVGRRGPMQVCAGDVTGLWCSEPSLICTGCIHDQRSPGTDEFGFCWISTY